MWAIFFRHLFAAYEFENFFHYYKPKSAFAEMEAVLAAQEVADLKEDEEDTKTDSDGKQGEGEEEEEGILNEEGVEETVEGLKREVAHIKKQLGEAKSEGAVAQLLQENVESMEKRNRSLEEELATTQMLLSEAMEGDQANVVARLKAAYKKLQMENQDLKIQLRLGAQSNSSGVGGGGGSGGGGEGLLGATVISDVTKSLARRVKSSVAQTVAGGAGTTAEEKEHITDAEADSLRAMVLDIKHVNCETCNLLAGGSFGRASCCVERSTQGNRLLDERI